MSDDEKWSRDGDKKDEDIDDLPEAEALLIPEAFPIPEVETAAPPPTENVADPRPKPGVSWTISVNEAVNYGFKSIKDVLPYLAAIILCYVGAIVSFNASISVGGTKTLDTFFLAFSFILFISAILIQLSLMIGLGYKFGGDILLRAVRFHHLIEKKK